VAYYEYQCEDCGHVFTIQETFTEHAEHERPACPRCGSEHVDQQLDSVHVKTSKKS
jgi:putative FmdB family regulatory protein